MAFDILALGELLIDFGSRESAPGAEKTLFPEPAGPRPMLAAAAALGARGRSSAGWATTPSAASSSTRWSATALTPATFPKIRRYTPRWPSSAWTRAATAPSPSTGIRGADLMPPRRPARAAVPGEPHLPFRPLSMTAEPARSATLAALALAKQSGCLVSYDPNWRPSSGAMRRRPWS